MLHNAMQALLTLNQTLNQEKFNIISISIYGFIYKWLSYTIHEILWQ